VPSNAAPVTPAAAPPELFSPEDAARLLGVTPGDVMTSLASGELKGKKIGSAWRITRKALDEFLNS
jgi:excisionase family DNA binding protein